MQSKSEEVSPYQPPKSATTVWLTSKGFTPAQCFWRFLLLGVVAAVIGSIGQYILTPQRQDAAIQLLSFGLSIGISLSVSIQLWIGAISTGKKILILAGSLIASGTCGTVYGRFLPEQFWRPQPITW